MKEYYIFNIKSEFVNLYKDCSSVLYNILKNIYYLDNNNVEYGYNLFKQLIIPFDYNKLDRELFIKLHKEIPYSKRGNTHYINNFYKNEISRLKINKLYIKLELEQPSSSFYKILNDNINNLFVCCFKNTDFFFLDDFLKEN